MDRQTLVNLILREAKRDFFNGRGRIFKTDFLKTYQIDEKSFVEALELLMKEGIVVESSLNDDILFVRFGDVCAPNKQTNQNTI